jgi:predicted dehydrogenase
MNSKTSVTRRNFLELSGGLTAGAILSSAGAAFSADKAAGRRIRIGVVGGGFGSTFHWHEHPGCVVAGVTDLRPDRRDKLRKVYQCDKAYDSLETMIKEAKDIDAVAVFSGALDHVKHAKLCLERGWHVISAVPACHTLEEARELKDAVKRTGLSYMMAETSYYRPECILMREMVRKGAMGNLFYTECEYYHDRGDLKRLGADPRSRFRDEDGGYSWRWGFPPMLYPTHSLGYITGVTGETIKSVSCLGWGTGDHPYLTENAYDNPHWNQAAMMQTDRGNMVRCNVFWLCAAHGERAQWFGDKATFYMHKGGVHESLLKFRTRGDTASRYDLPTQEGGDVEIPEYWQSEMLPPAMRHKSGHGNSHTFISAEFVNALLEGRKPAVDVDAALAMTVPGIVAHQSALKDGEQLKVPRFT